MAEPNTNDDSAPHIDEASQGDVQQNTIEEDVEMDDVQDEDEDENDEAIQRVDDQIATLQPVVELEQLEKNIVDRCFEIIGGSGSESNETPFSKKAESEAFNTFESAVQENVRAANEEDNVASDFHQLPYSEFVNHKIVKEPMLKLIRSSLQPFCNARWMTKGQQETLSVKLLEYSCIPSSNANEASTVSEILADWLRCTTRGSDEEEEEGWCDVPKSDEASADCTSGDEEKERELQAERKSVDGSKLTELYGDVPCSWNTVAILVGCTFFQVEGFPFLVRASIGQPWGLQNRSLGVAGVKPLADDEWSTLKDHMLNLVLHTHCPASESSGGADVTGTIQTISKVPKDPFVGCVPTEKSLDNLVEHLNVVLPKLPDGVHPCIAKMEGIQVKLRDSYGALQKRKGLIQFHSDLRSWTETSLPLPRTLSEMIVHCQLHVQTLTEARFGLTDGQKRMLALKMQLEMRWLSDDGLLEEPATGPQAKELQVRSLEQFGKASRCVIAVPHLSRREDQSEGVLLEAPEDQPEGVSLEAPLSAEFLLEAQDRSILQQQNYDSTVCRSGADV
jgi:hypothetical protein